MKFAYGTISNPRKLVPNFSRDLSSLLKRPEQAGSAIHSICCRDTTPKLARYASFQTAFSSAHSDFFDPV